MSMDHEPDPAPTEPPADPTGTGRWRTVAVLLCVGVLAAGWFALSAWVMHSSVMDAAGEALGVAFALLVVVSIIGAVLTGRREGS